MGTSQPQSCPALLSSGDQGEAEGSHRMISSDVSRRSEAGGRKRGGDIHLHRSNHVYRIQIGATHVALLRLNPPWYLVTGETVVRHCRCTANRPLNGTNQFELAVHESWCFGDIVPVADIDYGRLPQVSFYTWASMVDITDEERRTRYIPHRIVVHTDC